MHAAEDHAVDCCVGIHTDLIDLLSSEDAGFDHCLLQDICAHDGILAGHNGDFAAALLQSLLQTLGQKGSNLGKVSCHNRGGDHFCLADGIDNLLRLFDVGVCDDMINDLFLVIMIDQEEGILMILVDDVYKCVDNITEYDFKSAVMQKFRNKTAADFACSEMYCFFHHYSPLLF